MPNYLTYPSQIMRITQSYDGRTSHRAHMTGKPHDYSLDEGCTDGGRDWIYCGCDALKVVRITGTKNSKKTNTIWLTSTTACDLANGMHSVATLQFIHPNDDDLLKIKVGQIFKRGDKICREGNDGASGIHLHLAVGLGTITNDGWVQNTNGSWVLTTTGGPIKPEDAFFVDPAFTTIRDSKGLNFKTLTQGKPAPGRYEVTSTTLRIRKGTSTDTLILGELKNRERVEIVKTKKGLDGAYWGRTSVGWVCMDYLKKV